jgi:NADH-quinone oxidoreductase subunit E
VGLIADDAWEAVDEEWCTSVNADQVRAHIDPIRHEYAEARSLILPALKFAQTEKGHLTREDLEAVGEATGFSAAYVESVASFYDRLYLAPTGTRVVSVCVTLSCMLRGADEVWDHLCEREGVSHHGGTSEDGRITIQEAQCLGYCDRAPCLQVDAEETKGPFTPASAGAFVDALRAAPDPHEFWR